ncbi:hypothetical protein DRO64_00080 [Candidatus Bathyarchaeota archaeon]|nr:MAG: hypothetical protein DRO64_00080 [Candidatus Bathyarchaeota archaeon]
MGLTDDRAVKIIKALEKVKGPLTISEIADRLGLPEQEIYSIILKLERHGLVKRIYDEDFDITRPALTVKWSALKKAEARTTTAQLVASFPPRIGDFKKLCSMYGFIYLIDALEEVIGSARRSLRVMCPYVDTTFTNMLVRADCIRRGLVKVRIISERNSTSRSTLEYIKAILRGVEVKYADVYEGERKVSGVHAKAVIADEDLMLLGSFNLTIRHIATNLDAGVLLRGPAVVAFVKVFDDLWDRLPSF